MAAPRDELTAAPSSDLPPTDISASTDPEFAVSPIAYTEPSADVSRETSHIYGGTPPLADELADETRRRIALEDAVLPLPATTRIFTISNQKGGGREDDDRGEPRCGARTVGCARARHRS